MTDDELRNREINLTVTHQEIIELAYAVMAVLGPLAEAHDKLRFEEANGLLAAFYHIRRMLKVVDPAYLDRHDRAAKFFAEGRELSNEMDRLSWEATGDLRNDDLPA